MAKKEDVSNFIKKSDKVYLLSKNDSCISHDIPFKDNHSGSILINIYAETPIFIRNHYEDGDDYYEQKKEDKTIRISKEFNHIKKDGKKYYFIPATSIKGVIRNTIEILSYAKLKGKTSDKILEERIPEEHNLHRSDKIDLSEALFGTTELKGRITFSHCFAQGTPKVSPLKREILMTPPPKEKKFGWKNYPILDKIESSKKGNNDDVVSEFKTLMKDTKFIGKVMYHNLRDFELGALISALTYHDTKNSFHNIGLAKSLGYGKIKLSIECENKDVFLQAFEEKMNIELFNGKTMWHIDAQVKELIQKHSKSHITQKTKKESLKSKLEQHKFLLKEEAAQEYEKIKNSLDKVLLNGFRVKYPSFFENEILTKIKEIEKNEIEAQEAKEQWGKISNQIDKNFFLDFQQKFPSFYTQEVQEKIKEIDEIEKTKEIKAKKQAEEAKKAKQKIKNRNNALLSKLSKKK